MILIFVVFYLFLIRPQSKQKKEHERLLKNLSKGDKVLTRGGIYGTIINFQGKNKEILVIDSGSGCKLNIDRTYIVSPIKDKKD